MHMSWKFFSSHLSLTLRYNLEWRREISQTSLCLKLNLLEAPLFQLVNGEKARAKAFEVFGLIWEPIRYMSGELNWTSESFDWGVC